jgi:glycosyltransferase involved in cell wall biosynthesis
MTIPLVSIVVPLYNKEKYILECLQSVAWQDFSNWQCIIVDDGSDDGSAKLVDKFINSTPGNWKFLRKENGGPSSARNFGVLNSASEFIAFLDSDDIWMPNKLSRQVDLMRNSPDCLASLTDYVITQDFDSKVRGIRSSRSINLLDRWLNMRGFGGLVESTGLVRRSVFDSGVCFDETLTTGEGLDFMLRISILGRFCVVPDFLTIYRLSDGQLHKNEGLIEINGRNLATKYASDPSSLGRIMRDQKAYFAISKFRGLRKLRLFFTLIVCVMRLDLNVISVASSIIIRNVRANMVSRKVKKNVSNLKSSVSGKIDNLSL